MSKYYYEYIIQEKMGEFWFDKYITTDRKFAEQVLRVFRNKYSSCCFRVVRSIL